MEGLKSYKQSPIFYMGGKYRLINKGLIDLFPKKIDTFIDLFCGGGVVSMNTVAKNHVLNDKDKTLFSLFGLFKENSPNKIIEELELTIQQFQLIKGHNNNDKSVSEEYKALAKKRYFRFRKEYNKKPNIFWLYLLTFYSFSNMFRFNRKGEFNLPLGNREFVKKTYEDRIKDGCDFFSKDNVLILNGDYKEVDLNSLSESDFVYLDPPYSNTMAIYNEQQGWNYEDDQELFNLCERLNTQNVKWGLSNVFKNKGHVNQHLIEWCKKNNWTVYYFDRFTYTSNGKGNAQTEEVYICNY